MVFGKYVEPWKTIIEQFECVSLQTVHHQLNDPTQNERLQDEG